MTRARVRAGGGTDARPRVLTVRRGDRMLAVDHHPCAALDGRAGAHARQRPAPCPGDDEVPAARRFTLLQLDGSRYAAAMKFALALCLSASGCALFSIGATQQPATGAPPPSASPSTATPSADETSPPTDGADNAGSAGSSSRGYFGMTSGNDCRALIGNNAGLCDTANCRAVLGDNAGLCDDSECRALIGKNSGLCDSSDCRALVGGNSGLCETSDCRAMIGNNSGLCDSSFCRAMVDRNSGLCP